MQKPRATSAGPVDTGRKAVQSLGGDKQLDTPTGPAPQCNSQVSCAPGSSSADGYERLIALARCLARPVAFGWLSLAVADAALVNAVCQSVPAGADVLDVWRDMQSILRREVANARS